MPAVMAPVVMMPRAIAADLARTVIGPDDPAVRVRVIIIGRRIVEVPVKAVVPEREPAVAKAPAMENMTASKPAAVKYGAATTEAPAVEGRAAAVKAASAAVKTAAAMATAMSAAAFDFRRQSAGRVFGGRRRTWIDQRKRLGAFTRRSGEHQHRGSRKAQRTERATGDAAPRIWNLQHV